MASATIFCPQSKAPGEKYLGAIHSYLCKSRRLTSLAKCVLDLSEVWEILATARQDVASLIQGPRSLKILSDWITTGQSSQLAECMSGITSLPLLVIIQICQYFQYLEICRISHRECIAQVQNGGGMQGYCGGLLAAIAIASSRDEEEVVANAMAATRIAFAIGVCGELGDDNSSSGATTIVVRTQRVGQGDELVQEFPGSYISAVTDPKTISIVGPATTLVKVQSRAQEKGMLVQGMHIRGKVHNPENKELAQNLCSLCEKHGILQLPHVESLQAPVRSNKTGDLLTKTSLTNEIVTVILASRCEWYTLLTKMAKDLVSSGRRVHTFATFGIGDCTPLSPFHKVQLRITKVDVQSLIAEQRPGSENGTSEQEYIPPSNAIAIVGASCRLSGANDLEELWNLISSGQSRYVEVTADRFNLHGSFRASQDRKSTESRKFFGNFLENVDCFDHAFFRINPREAANMDPQQRILLELAYQAMESSGYLATHRRESEDSVGCFIGASFAEYLDNTNAYPPTAYTSTGTIRAFLCGRISHYFGWSGPAEVLDTACSSSLVAINRACKAIQGGECKLALTGGINIITGINNFLDLSKAGFLSPTGQCKPFDEAADGYCRSEGGGLVVLKLLSQAMADNDQILGVIPGVATNQGGLSSSITIPHAPAQKRLYQTVLDQADMRPEQVTYVEAHGTGTQAGDPVEIASIREVFGSQDRKEMLNVGSLKGNIGHTETAAGVASLLKILTMIQKTGIVPQASHETLNQKIPALEADGLKIPLTLSRWKVPLLAACINSYGAAGSNCAMICCQRPADKTNAESQKQHIRNDISYPIILSAVSRESLFANMESLRRYLEKATPGLSPADVAFTLCERRSFYHHRFITSIPSTEALAQHLGQETRLTSEMPAMPRRVVLAFGGQSKLTCELDKNLYESHPRLRYYINDCENLMKRLGYPSLLPSLFHSEPLTDLVILQCGTFATQYAYAKCWLEAGLRIDAIIGHSFGELTGMVVSGILSLSDGLRFVASRAALMATKWDREKGSMLSIHSSVETVQAVLAHINSDSQESEVEIACYNAPSSQVVVGTSLAINRTEQLLNTDPRFADIRSQRLDVARGFHSKFTEPILEDIDKVSETLEFSKSDTPLETCTRKPVVDMTSSRLSQHAREPVYFSDAVQRLEERLGPCVWLEAGVGSPIIPMIKRALTRPDHSFQAIRSPSSQKPTEQISQLITDFWREGISVSYWKFMRREHDDGKQIWLPPYQFQPTVHWLTHVDHTMEVQKKAMTEEIEPTKKRGHTKEPPKLVRLLRHVENGSSEFSISLSTLRFSKIVSGHAVRQRPLCPASMYMECVAMGVQLLRGRIGAGGFDFLNMSFQAPLGVNLEREAFLTLEESKESQEWNFSIKTTEQLSSKTKTLTHAKGVIVANANTDFQLYQRLVADRITELGNNPKAEKLLSTRAYGLFSQVVHYAHFLRGIQRIVMEKNEALAEIEIPEEAYFGITESSAAQYCDTVAIDNFIQVLGLLINSSALVTGDNVFVATGVDRVFMSSACDFDCHKSWSVYTKYTNVGEGKAAGDVFVMAFDGTLAMMITGAQFTKLPISKLEKLLDESNAGSPKAAAITMGGKFEILVKESEFSRLPPVVKESGRPPAIASSSPLGSNESELKFAKPVHVIQIAEKRLLSIIAEYTGLRAEEVVQDVKMSDIGVDSLAAVEFAEELQSAFGKDISAEDVLVSSFRGLLESIVSNEDAIDQVSATPKALDGDLANLSPSSLSEPSYPSSSVSSSSSRSSINGSRDQEKLGAESICGQSRQGDNLSLFTTKPIEKVRERSNLQSSYAFRESNGPACTQSKQSEMRNPSEVLVQCEAQFNEIATQRGFVDYWKLVAPGQDELLLAYICEAFDALGIPLDKLEQGKLVPPIPHQPKYDKVLNRLLSILEKHNILDRRGSELVRGSRSAPATTARNLHEGFLEKFPPYEGEARLMALTGPKLADCLSGKTDPLTLLFRGGSAQKVMEDYYCNSPMLSTLTELLVNLISVVLKPNGLASSGQTIRILEVGAGFGGTTQKLAQALEESNVSVSYTFSDISPSLVQRAKSKLSKFAWMEFQVLNLEHEIPISLQNTYDIVIGTNCVHATADKLKTLSRLRSALSRRGFLALSEVTQIIDWYDLVFGLLDGWWLAKDGSTYPLQPAGKWVEHFQQAGFSNITYSKAESQESNTQRLFVACNKKEPTPAPLHPTQLPFVQTAVYKEVDDVQIEADIYLPSETPLQPMPVALMIHGGGYMTLSRKAIRPEQTLFLLEHDVLPVSIDYRLCPEINMVEGPIADVCDAYGWVLTRLQSIVRSQGFSIDEKKIVVIGWSTGGHLAMTTAWKATEAGYTPPTAILSFYGPTDFESGSFAEVLDERQGELYPEQCLSVDGIISSFSTRPITSHVPRSKKGEINHMAWLQRGDPRSELVLSLFKNAHGLPLLLNGIHHANGKTWKTPPSPDLIASISPLSHVRRGTYTTPTFLVHGTQDEVVPYHNAVSFYEAMQTKKVRSGFAEVKGAGHMHDLNLRRGDEGFKECVEVGYDFLFGELDIV